jgi:hypothetical protein
VERGAFRLLRRCAIMTAMLDDAMIEYVNSLGSAYPAIREIWLLGSRAAGTERPDSDWDFLAFADEETLRRLSGDHRLNRPNADLFVVYDGDNFRKPWLDGDKLKKGSLSGWIWTRGPDGKATYRATKERAGNEFNVDVTTGRAIRVWPAGQS